MDCESLARLTGALPCFDLPPLIQGFDDRRDGIRVQLSRWMKQGRVIGLRRGMYTLAEMYHHAPAVTGGSGEPTASAILPERALGTRLS